MPSLREYKVALKGSALSFIAGAHCVSQMVWQRASDRLSEGKRDDVFQPISNLLKSMLDSAEAVQQLADLMNEESLYPFGDLWPAEGLGMLVALSKAPTLNFEEAHEFNTEFRFKKGFQNTLDAIAKERYLEADEESEVTQSLLDHWLLLVLNTSFYAGTIAAARMAPNGEPYYTAINVFEEESEAWSRYVQLVKLFDKELSRDEGGGNAPSDDYGADYDF